METFLKFEILETESLITNRLLQLGGISTSRWSGNASSSSRRSTMPGLRIASAQCLIAYPPIWRALANGAANSREGKNSPRYKIQDRAGVEAL